MSLAASEYVTDFLEIFVGPLHSSVITLGLDVAVKFSCCFFVPESTAIVIKDILLLKFY